MPLGHRSENTLEMCQIAKSLLRTFGILIGQFGMDLSKSVRMELCLANFPEIYIINLNIVKHVKLLFR